MVGKNNKDYRDAGDGEYVTPEYAAANPLTTVSEERKPNMHKNFNPDSDTIPIEEIENYSDEELQDILIEMERVYLAIVKPFYENQKNLLSEIHKRKGVDYYFQDEVSGAVLKTSIQEYKSVSLFDLGLSRTRFSDEEAKQSLSNKEAEEKGFILKFGDRRKKK